MKPIIGHYGASNKYFFRKVMAWRGAAIIWTNEDPVHRHIHTSADPKVQSVERVTVNNKQENTFQRYFPALYCSTMDLSLQFIAPLVRMILNSSWNCWQLESCNEIGDAPVWKTAYLLYISICKPFRLEIAYRPMLVIGRYKYDA